MSNKWKQRILVLAVSLLLAGFSIACLIKPADAISLSERRPLAQFPKVTADSLLSGRFMKQFDSYAVDQFPMRESFRKWYAFVSRNVLHKSDIEGIFLKNGSAIKMEYPLQKDSLAHASKIFQNICKTQMQDFTGNIYLSIIPDKNYFFREDDSVLTMDYDTLFETMQKQNPQMNYIDLTSLLQIEDYYTTDPHWRQECIGDVARELAEQMSATLAPQFQVKKASDAFRGTYAGQSALPIPSETISYVTNPVLEQCKVYDHQNNREIGMYDQSKVEARDPYELFLSGPLSYITIENPNATTKKELVIFRDSYGSALAPYLATGYKKVTLIDIRYLPSRSLPSMISFQDQDVLFLYSTSVLNHSETLK